MWAWIVTIANALSVAGLFKWIFFAAAMFFATSFGCDKVNDRRVNVVERRTKRICRRECRIRCDCPGLFGEEKEVEAKPLDEAIDSLIEWWYEIEPVPPDDGEVYDSGGELEPTPADPEFKAAVEAAQEVPNPFGWAEPKEVSP